MSGELEITHGGAIAVDTTVLRDIGARIAHVAAVLDGAHDAVRRAHAAIVGMPGFTGGVDTVSLWAGGETVGTLRAQCEEAATGTLLMADVYELVELRVQAEAIATADAAAADALRQRIERLEASDERLSPMADTLVRGWERNRFDGLDRQFDLGGHLAPFFFGASLLGVIGRRGVVRPGATLTGSADPVRVSAVRTSMPVTAADGLADSFRRLPAEGAQIAVEKLTMPDGVVRYVAYIKGTQSALAGGAESWDMESNLDLYSGHRSASFEATMRALADAGAGPGDTVDVVAHSQAGMIAAYLSSEGGFDVEMQITAGSPVSPVADEGQTVVQLRHSDDVVSSLAGGGSPGGTGSPDSFTATREDDGEVGLPDAWDPHLVGSYVDLAEEVDASGDPRVAALDGYWRRLNEAVSIERTEYHAERAG